MKQTRISQRSLGPVALGVAAAVACVQAPENGATISSSAAVPVGGFLFHAGTEVAALAWRHDRQLWHELSMRARSADRPLVEHRGESLHGWSMSLDLADPTWWSGPGGRGEARVRFQQVLPNARFDLVSFERGGFGCALTRANAGEFASSAGLACASPVSPVINLRRNRGLTNVYLVRHGERASGAEDSLLSPEGHARAEGLADELAYAEIDVILVTSVRRTQQTAAPLAARRGLTPVILPLDSTRFVQEILNQPERNVLVVGHAGPMLPAIVRDLGAAPPVAETPTNEYDNLLLVHRDVATGAATSVRRKYLRADERIRR